MNHNSDNSESYLQKFIVECLGNHKFEQSTEGQTFKSEGVELTLNEKAKFDPWNWNFLEPAPIQEHHQPYDHLRENFENFSFDTPVQEEYTNLAPRSKGISKYLENVFGRKLDKKDRSIKSFVQNYFGKFFLKLGDIHNSYSIDFFTEYGQEYSQKIHSVYLETQHLFKNEHQLTEAVNRRFDKEISGKIHLRSLGGKDNSAYLIKNKKAIYKKLFDPIDPRIVALNSVIVHMMNFVFDSDEFYADMINRIAGEKVEVQAFMVKNRMVFKNIFNDKERKLRQAKYEY